MRIDVIGDWHNALVTAAGLAELRHEVTLVSPKEWPLGIPQLDENEPGLNDLLNEMHAAGRLKTARTLSGPIVWVAIDTVLREDDSSDTESVETAAIAAITCTTSEIVVIGSQVPLGFCQKIEQQFAGSRVAYVPENYQLGAALTGFRYPDRLVIGATYMETRVKVAEIFGHLPYSRTPPILCDLPTAEMVKHATNAFLATSISLANELASIGERHGVDSYAVARALRLDRRIGPRAFVRPGLGFSGGTLARDLRSLQKAASRTPIVDAVLNVNARVTSDVASSVIAYKPRVVCLLGYTYKADTDAIRGSLVPYFVKRFREENILALGYDPRFDGKYDLHEKLKIGPGAMPTWACLEQRPGGTEGGVDVFVCMTPLKEFRSLDWSRCKKSGVVLDLCEGISREDVLKAGLAYKALWCPAVKRPTGPTAPTEATGPTGPSCEDLPR